MKANGAKTLLVSGGFSYYTARVAEAAGFDEHLSNTLIDDGKVLTGTVREPILGARPNWGRCSGRWPSSSCMPAKRWRSATAPTILP